MASPVSSSLLSTLKTIRNRSLEEAPEVCNFCGAKIPAEHRHMMNVSAKKFMCACEVCTVLLSVNSSYKLIPGRYSFLKDFNMPQEVWDDFMIPVDMAFFVFSTAHEGIVAYYPAAAGATESKLKMEAWKNVERLNPEVNTLVPDLEALLVNRLEPEGKYFIVPIDECYRLIGIIKSNWQGINGGREVQDAMHKFFDDLKKKIADA